jgi:hypothetical protein
MCLQNSFLLLIRNNRRYTKKADKILTIIIYSNILSQDKRDIINMYLSESIIVDGLNLRLLVFYPSLEDSKSWKFIR